MYAPIDILDILIWCVIDTASSARVYRRNRKIIESTWANSNIPNIMDFIQNTNSQFLPPCVSIM
jgi:hypothetical protein